MRMSLRLCVAITVTRVQWTLLRYDDSGPVMMERTHTRAQWRSQVQRHRHAAWREHEMPDSYWT
ncbi:hypothetical protein DICSQDRAFT_141380 [Dichomitus squalens LYAD-421 SS1]|uniref:Secreted protein n=1 Tax=Dichomitus squalens (strain LYAD-421) TaxID=732165 RepID=R7SJB3_DICSQ|nr:uncharacterized protein DICSQDRAFT_141380 [Dichomitus squalens LYAD-421 SS1]EJF56236.1 hypothetical protein DICSQDRAFT_141380 [Dichomitus squalens LYAD-421 SS1]